MVDDLGDAWAEIRALKKDIERLKAANPLESASVTKGRVRFIGGELRIDSGGRLIIEGTLSVDGVTTVTGSFTVSGPWNLTGDGTVTGKLVQNGAWELNGNGKITGTVDVSGRVNVGTAMALVPSTNGGQVEFSTGYLAAIAGALGLYKSGGGSVVLNTAANLVGPGCSFVAGATPSISGLPTIAKASANNAVAGTVWSDTAGKLYRVV